MKDIMVKMGGSSHAILIKWKKKLRDQGVRVPLGETIREMERLIKDQDLGFSKTDLRVIRNCLEKLSKIATIYGKPSFSGVVVKMDTMIKDREG
ncbi:MAG: hypothetical protein V1854_04930 [Methanobacteriota archaeon]